MHTAWLRFRSLASGRNTSVGFIRYWFTFTMLLLVVFKQKNDLLFYTLSECLARTLTAAASVILTPVKARHKRKLLPHVAVQNWYCMWHPFVRPSNIDKKLSQLSKLLSRVDKIIQDGTTGPNVPACNLSHILRVTFTRGPNSWLMSCCGVSGLWTTWKNLSVTCPNRFWKVFAAAIRPHHLECFHRLKFCTNEMSLPTERVGVSFRDILRQMLRFVFQSWNFSQPALQN